MRIWISIELDSLCCCSAYFAQLVRLHTHIDVYVCVCVWQYRRFPRCYAKEFEMGKWVWATFLARCWPCIKIVAYFQARPRKSTPAAIINLLLHSPSRPFSLSLSRWEAIQQVKPIKWFKYLARILPLIGWTPFRLHKTLTRAHFVCESDSFGTCICIRLSLAILFCIFEINYSAHSSAFCAVINTFLIKIAKTCKT